MRLASRLVLATVGTLSSIGCGKGQPPPSEPELASPPSEGTTTAPSRKSVPEASPWVVASQPDLRTLTFIVEVEPPPAVAAVYADLGARHRDLRPLMEAHNEGGFGSGFLMVARGTDTTESAAYIVTNQHVVGVSSRVSLGREGTTARVSADVLYVDPTYDLAIVEVSAEARALFAVEAGLGLTRRPPHDQDVVVASGFPGIQGDPSYQVTRGYVSNERLVLDVDGEKLPHIQHTAPIDSGSSGGPLLDEEGRVLGINTLKVRWREGVGLAVPAAAIRTALDAVRTREHSTASNAFAARESCEQLLDSVASDHAWGRADRLISAELIAEEGARSLWLLPEDDTDWFGEFVMDPAHVMARAIVHRVRYELGASAKGLGCDAQSSPDSDQQTFALGAGDARKSLTFALEQGMFKLHTYSFAPGSGRSFLDPKPTAGKKWKPSL